MRSIRKQGYVDAFLNLNDESQVGAPTHDVAPYAFKPAMFSYAQGRGYDMILWADSAVFAIANLEPIFEHIENHGHVFFANGCVGEWSSDAALDSFKIGRDEAMRITELTGCLMGLDLRQPKAARFLIEWKALSRDGKTFPGSWNNNNGEVSADPRVKGHRHDQTAASLLAHEIGMELTASKFFQYFISPTRKPWSDEEENDMNLIRPDTILCNQGM